MKSAKEIRDQVKAVRERVRRFSGYWIGEAAAAIYALEWVSGKRDTPPSEDIGSPGGGHEKIAASLLKLAEAGKPAARRLRIVRNGSRPETVQRKARERKPGTTAAKKK